MEVAFLSEITDDRRTFVAVDSDPWFRPIAPGDSDLLQESYCGRVLDGRAPHLIVDAAREPSVMDLAATWDIPIGSHLSVPVFTTVGAVFGTLCCFSRQVDQQLAQRNVEAMHLFAAVISKHLEPLVEQRLNDAAYKSQIFGVLEGGGPAIALQPIIELASGSIEGYEALARFPSALGTSPDLWFAAADRLGLGRALEASAVVAALRLFPRIPQPLALSVNVSAPALLAISSIVDLLLGADGSRLILEVTEHHKIPHQNKLQKTLAHLRGNGIRIAIDDAGSGYSGLERILFLAPEVVKLDRTLIDGIASHPGRQAMCEAMVAFTRRTHATLVAEGVETVEDLNTLRELGVSHAQGYLLGRPTIWPNVTMALGDRASGARDLEPEASAIPEPLP